VRITNSDAGAYGIRPENSVQNSYSVARQGTTGSTAGAHKALGDTLELSPQVRTLQRLHDIVRAAPDIRTARVTAAQHALTTHTLTLQGAVLADKVIAGALSIG
jgi:hypothetical protein